MYDVMGRVCTPDYFVCRRGDDRSEARRPSHHRAWPSAAASRSGRSSTPTRRTSRNRCVRQCVHACVGERGCCQHGEQVSVLGLWIWWHLCTQIWVFITPFFSLSYVLHNKFHVNTCTLLVHFSVAYVIAATIHTAKCKLFVDKIVLCAERGRKF